jgi:hypothetical protein
MSEETTVQEEVVVKKKRPGPICIGADIGTMFLGIARNDSPDVKLMRNVFIETSEDETPISELTNISYVKTEEGKIFIIGDDAFKFANIFSKEVSRPMQKGLISPREINAIEVLGNMIKMLIGDDISNREVYCNYSVPAEALDEGRSVTYHERVFGKIFSSLGINNKPLNEAMAIIYSECASEQFSGIALSFGAGMVNTCASYRGIEAGKFSTSRSGDYIDNCVAQSLDMVPNRVSSIKEKFLDLSANAIANPNKKTERVIEALRFYYESVINYNVKKMVDEFNKQIDVEIDDKIPIIVSGGTSMPNGFLEMFKNVFLQYQFPFSISEIRRAKSPLTAVSSGLLIKTLSEVSK